MTSPPVAWGREGKGNPRKFLCLRFRAADRIPNRFDTPDAAIQIYEEGEVNMAKDGKALSKSQTADHLAKSTGTTKKQATQFLDDLTALAYKEAKNSFTIPGVGKLVLVNRKARLGRNPATGEEIKIPAKRVVKFRVSKKAKDAILGPKK